VDPGRCLVQTSHYEKSPGEGCAKVPPHSLGDGELLERAELPPFDVGLMRITCQLL
jgi:hypothetical protein